MLSGVLGLGVNLLGIMLIRQTSPLTYIMAIGTKSCLQTILAAALFGNPLSNMVSAKVEGVFKCMSRHVLLCMRGGGVDEGQGVCVGNKEKNLRDLTSLGIRWCDTGGILVCCRNRHYSFRCWILLLHHIKAVII